jgi:hypothetical protein
MYTFRKFLVIQQKLVQKSDLLKKINVFSITYCQMFHPKNPFDEKMKMTK